MRYSFEPLPEGEEQDARKLTEYLSRALSDLSSSVNGLYDGEVEVATASPPKPREGMMRYADGTAWNPAGVGKGLVVFDGTNWVSFQAYDADLAAIAALGFTATAFLKKTAANTWALDTNSYINKAGDTGISGNLSWASGVPRALEVAFGSDLSTLTLTAYGVTAAKRASLGLNGAGDVASLTIDNGSLQLQLRLSQASGLQYYNGGAYKKVWHEDNDGTTSGLDADLLDGYHGAAAATANTYVLRDANGSILIKEALFEYLGAPSVEGGQFYLQKPGSGSSLSGNVTVDVNTNSIRFWDAGGTFKGAYIDITACAAGAGSKIWHADNDGASSGLDSDLLDGQHGSYYTNAGNLNAGTIPDARFPATLPAASGVNLTSLNASNLGSGTVPTARLGSSSNSWSPSITGSNDVAVSSQTITAGSYYEIGNYVFFSLDGTVNTVGSATGNIRIPLPVGAVQGGSAQGWRADSGFYGLTVAIYDDIDKMDIVRSSDGSSILAAGTRFRIDGFYRKA